MIHGDLEGVVRAYDGDSGAELWSFRTGSGHRGGPISYSVNGKQYIAVPSGLGSLVLVSTRPCGPRSSTSRRAARSSSSRSGKVVHSAHRGGTGRPSVPPRCIIRGGGSPCDPQAHRRCDGGGAAARSGDRLARRFLPGSLKVRTPAALPPSICPIRRSSAKAPSSSGRSCTAVLPRQGRRAVQSAQAAGSKLERSYVYLRASPRDRRTACPASRPPCPGRTSGSWSPTSFLLGNAEDK